METHRNYIGLLAGAALLLMACGEEINAPPGDTALLSVTPVGGATDVDPNTPVTLEFEHAMHADMYVALHEGGDVSGELVDGAWTWSDDTTRLTFRHMMPLDSMSDYCIHIGGGMMDAEGHTVDLEQHGHDMGGEWVTEQMMDQRMMQGGGMMGDDDMLGAGGIYENGTYGMIFTFTTKVGT